MKHGTHLVAHKSCCFSCNQTCEVIVYTNASTGRVEKIEGDPESPVTGGILCSKGLAATDLVNNRDRLLTPLKRAGERGEDRWTEISWEEAIDEIALRLETLKAEYGPEGLAFLEGTRRGWSRVFTRLANAYGVMNHGAAGWAQCLWPRLVDCNSTFGAPYTEAPDLKNSKAVIVWGANPPNTWPVFAKEIMDAKGNEARLIVVDPYLSECAAKADIWMQLKPGTDTALALTMLNYIIGNSLHDEDFVRDWTVGFNELKESLTPYTLEWGENITGVNREIIREASLVFATTDPASLYRCVAVDQQHDSVQACRATSILVAITGNVGNRGGNVLVSKKGEISQNTHDFIGYEWISEDQQKLRIGYDDFPLLTQAISPVPTAHMPSLWEAIATQEPYPIKGALIFGSNAVLAYSNSSRVKEAMDQLDLVVVADLFMTETAKQADIVLPASSWLERDNVIPSFQSSRTSLLCQQKVTSLGQSKSDLEIIFMLAGKLGLSDKFWETPEQMYDYLLKPAGETLASLKRLRRIEKPVDFQSYKKTGFATRSGKVELASSALKEYGFPSLPEYEPAESPEAARESAEFPFVMTTGARLPFFRHTENRNNPTLRSMWRNPSVFINTVDAGNLGVGDGQIVKIVTEAGESTQHVVLSDGMAEGFIQVIPGWGGDGNINLTVPWKNFARGIGSVPMRYIRCRVDPVVGQDE